MYRSGIRYSEAVREFQSVFILTVLREHKANQLRAAQKLGIHRNTLRRIIRNLELDIRLLRPTTRRRPPLSEHAVPVQTKAGATYGPCSAYVNYPGDRDSRFPQVTVIAP